MADNLTSKVLLEVEIPTQGPVKNIKELKDAISDLKAKQDELKKAKQEDSAEYVVLEQKIKALNSAIAQNSKEIQANIKQSTNAKGSYNALSAELAQLKKAYHEAGNDEDREKILKNLVAVDKKLKELDAAQGVFVRNVGNYPSAFAKVGQAVELLKNPLKTLKFALNSIYAHPLITTIGVIVIVLKKISDALKGNQAAMEKLTVAFSAFNGVGVIVNKLFDKLANGIARVAGWIGDLAEKWGLITDEMKESQAISKEEIEIQKEQMRVAKKVAENEQQIADLRAKSADKEKYSAQQRLSFLREASKLEEDNAQMAFDLAQREYELQKRKNAQSDSSLEDLKKENDLYIAMVQTQTALANKQRELTTQINRAVNEIKAEAEAVRKIAEEEAKLIEEVLQKADESTRKMMEERKKQYQQMIDDLYEEEVAYEEKLQAIRDEYSLEGARSSAQQEIDAFIAKYGAQIAQTEEGEAAIAAIRQKYADKANEELVKKAQDASKKMVDSISKYAQEATQMMSQVSQMMSGIERRQLQEYEDANNAKEKSLAERLEKGIISERQYNLEKAKLDEELDKKQREIERKQAKREKALAIMQTIINTAMGIAKAVSENPMVGGLPGSAIMAATGAAQLATILAEPLPKASRGALLKGKSHAQGGIPIEAEGGEAIINKKATARYLPLLSAINQSTGGIPLYGSGGVVQQQMRDVGMGIDYDRLAQACANIKTYVTVTDINNGQARYAKVESLRTY